jgi:hypothetical protein
MACLCISGCLGAFNLRPSWGRHASVGSTKLFAAMQDMWMSLHSIRSGSTFSYGFLIDCFNHYRRTFMCHAFQDPTGYPRILGNIASSRLARLQGLLEVGLARLLAAMLGDLGVSTLCFDQDHDSVFFSFLSIKPAMLHTSMLGDYSTRASLTPSCFFIIPTYWETCFWSRRYSTYLFFSFFLGSSYWPSYQPWCLDTTLWVRPWRALISFIVASIYWKPASYRLLLDLSLFCKDYKQVSC